MRGYGGYAITGVLLLLGCQPTQKYVALERLPGPYFIECPPSPAPAALVTAPPPADPAENAWLPPAGISPRWQCIVIHHSASDLGSMGDIDEWHRAKGWDSCGYDFVIGNGTDSDDGQVEASPRWRDQSVGAHTRLFGEPSSPQGNYYNEHGIGIVLVGNFDDAKPSEKQMQSLAKLINFLSSSCKIPPERIYLHGELKATDCPGRHFVKSDLLRRLKASS